jgi:hypothetical protein
MIMMAFSPFALRLAGMAGNAAMAKARSKWRKNISTSKYKCQEKDLRRRTVLVS